MNKQSEISIEVAKKVGSLRDFLDLLESKGQFITWPDEVMPEPDIRNILVAAGDDDKNGPAILFDKIKGYPGKRMVAGVHGSFSNIATLLGYPLGTPIRDLFYDIVGRWTTEAPQLPRIAPDKAPIHEVRIEENFNLFDLLPLYRINAMDGGFYIGKANVVSRDPHDPDNFGKQNVGIYRIQPHGPDTFTLMSVPVHDMGRHMLAAEMDDVPLKIAVMLGNHPAMAMFAATPIGYDESEYAYAAGMMGAPIALTESGNGLDIQAEGEMVIEAEYIHGERQYEGPFGEFPGSYSGVRRAPVFKITGISHRKNPIFENIYIGKGWTEHDTLIGLNTSAPIYAVLKKEFPEVEAVNALYQHGLTAIISVKNRFAGFAKSVALRALGTPHGLVYLKNLIMVDADVDPFDLNQVMWALSVRTRASDIQVLDNMAGIMIDPAAVIPGMGHHLIIDATTHMAPEPIGGDVEIVRRPAGQEIDDLSQIIKSMQKEARK
ncbi:MAG: UbiD family decarboxylase [Gammaproteobacteria bacterium]|nr:MAG: UbiD family decarboxylase [Gammaproteobacteria bacterium]RLA14888.1 MAG: UbiD family decarboxylase [Gammaproteobacteria bacterium]